MAEPTPFQLAARKQVPNAKITQVYAYDPYNFSHITTSSGTNPPLSIPAVGPNAAGAPPPTTTPSIVDTIITITGSLTPEYGNDFGGNPPTE